MIYLVYSAVGEPQSISRGFFTVFDVIYPRALKAPGLELRQFHPKAQ